MINSTRHITNNYFLKKQYIQLRFAFILHRILSTGNPNNIYNSMTFFCLPYYIFYFLYKYLQKSKSVSLKLQKYTRRPVGLKCDQSYSKSIYRHPFTSNVILKLIAHIIIIIININSLKSQNLSYVLISYLLIFFYETAVFKEMAQ